MLLLKGDIEKYCVIWVVECVIVVLGDFVNDGDLFMFVSSFTADLKVTGEGVVGGDDVVIVVCLGELFLSVCVKFLYIKVVGYCVFEVFLSVNVWDVLKR